MAHTFGFLAGTAIVVVGLVGFILGVVLLITPKSTLNSIAGLGRFMGSAAGGSPGLNRLSGFVSWLVAAGYRKFLCGAAVVLLCFAVMFGGSYLAAH